jgi:alkylation response protein AidB-like acyl-CoA dehydrogenase
VIAALLRAGSKAQRRRWLPGLVAGERFGALAYLEDADRHDADGIALAARRTREGWRLDGTKLFVAGVPGADLLLVAARSGRRGIALPRRCGYARRPCAPRKRSTSPGGSARSACATSRSSATRSSARRARAGPRSRAFSTWGGRHRGRQPRRRRAHARHGGRVLKVRQQFGRPIGSFQALKHMAAEMVADVEPARSLVWYAAWAFDHRPREATRAAAIAKARLGDVYSRTANRSVQMHGGIGSRGSTTSSSGSARGVERGRVRRSDVPPRAARDARRV